MDDKELKETLEAQGFIDPDIPQVKTLLGMPEARVVLRWLADQREAAVEGLLRSSPERVLQDQGRAATLTRLYDKFAAAISAVREA